MSDYRIVPAGDSALVVEFEERIDPAVNARAIGCADTIGKVIAAEYSAIAVYLVMALILLWRPQGIANKA